MESSAKVMASLLPEKVVIAKTPDIPYITYPTIETNVVEVQMEYVELKTIDLINAFMTLQQDALKEANRLKSEKARRLAVEQIHNMVFF